MSQFKEKVLSEISFAMVDDVPDLQKLYDKVAATDEHSELNDNQKIVLEWLKEKTCKCNKPVYPMNLVRKAVEKMPIEIVNYYDHLSDREEFEVLAAFAQWGLEQEEA